jgi:hypothetical protein
MLTKMQNTVQMVLRQYKNRNAIASDTEPTKWSWAKQIKSYDAVPDTYKIFFKPFLASGQTFPYTVLTPSFNRFMFNTSEKLVCDLGNEIVVLERFENTFKAQYYPMVGISYLEVRTVLLDSRIKICGLTRDGTNTSSTLKFNSVTDYLFDPILQKIRLTGVASRNVDSGFENGKFDRLMDVNFKFMNYSRRSMLAGEKVIHFILQPEIQEKTLRFLWMTLYRTIHPTHMVILTDWELILIREEKMANDSGKYGGTWDFIPLNKIEKLSLRESDHNLFMLSIQLPGTTSFEVPIRVSAKEDVGQLLASYSKLTTK